MKKPKGTLMRLAYVAGIALVCATLGFADTITLKSGRVINGTFLGGTARTVRVDDGVNVRTIDVSDIARIEFSGKDRAAGKHWEDWVKAYNAKKAAGEKNIALHPESLE